VHKRTIKKHENSNIFRILEHYPETSYRIWPGSKVSKYTSI